ncbi:TetR/AcrR family transcriptional regulator [Actinomadura darangshiensis]|uniref:TetR/AcrR family transcriptional regulator n=1 Tax=Actinomadura darangshiensis TaxID=705336 RepID=UPI001408D8B0|nr:TetR/AcrR family transcriptional regulator [Actinomadura darangshiensis]
MQAHDDAPANALTEQGRRTRAALVQAAERVFCRRGYAQSRINDFTAEAGVSVGTFYSYFASKEAVFLDVTAAYRRRLRDALADTAGTIDALNIGYLEVFRANAALWRVLEEAALSIPHLRPAVMECRREFTAAALAVVPDPATALAVTAMTEQCAAQWSAEGPLDVPEAAARLAAMWSRMLGDA